MPESGYTGCRCRDCFEIAVSDDVMSPDFCQDCEEAGCEADAECQVEGAYGGTLDAETRERLAREIV